jgi:hypothetical protein
VRVEETSNVFAIEGYDLLILVYDNKSELARLQDVGLKNKKIIKNKSLC